MMYFLLKNLVTGGKTFCLLGQKQNNDSRLERILTLKNIDLDEEIIEGIDNNISWELHLFLCPAVNVDIDVYDDYYIYPNQLAELILYADKIELPKNSTIFLPMVKVAEERYAVRVEVSRTGKKRYISYHLPLRIETKDGQKVKRYFYTATF